MKTATITEAKNGLSSLIDRVRAGETVLITDRGRPVARLEPVTALGETDGRLLRLERAGSLRIGEAAPPIDRLRQPAPRLREGASAVEALLVERRDGR
jgi:prevent-host-death family protein